MPTSLSKEHRKLLENTTTAARVRAESGCRAALEYLAVHEPEPREHMTVEQRRLRDRLRARGQALGDSRDARSGSQEIDHLGELAAYEHWHRLLFTRFLTENHLLITDEANGGVPVTLADCEELAPELNARDGFDLACRFASLTLPGVFRRDDPVLELPVAINDQVALRQLLNALPAEVFRADDALGWTYQFWQAQRKDEVNRSGKKIGADELSPVTQLFTEDYMVEFLLHNTLGAWWAGQRGPITAATEAEARAQVALSAREGVPGLMWPYLRFVQEAATQTWLPAAGTFAGWPEAVRLMRLLDPCMGSGHFLVFALPLLVRLRMEEEALDPAAAVTAVLRDNLHGLELDERCTQIAAFNVALTAWKLAGYQALPRLNLACCGLAPHAKKEDWLTLAGDHSGMRFSMGALYDLFQKAPVLGSLIDPRKDKATNYASSFRELQPLLEQALADERADDAAHELAVIAQGIAKAAELLAAQFTLVMTNVPYLARGKQDNVLKAYCEQVHANAKADLATCFVERCLEFCTDGGSTTLVTPQNWLFLGSYKKQRECLLKMETWNLVVLLGAKSFQTPMWDFNVQLITLTHAKSVSSQMLRGLDASMPRTVEEKAGRLRDADVVVVEQAGQLGNPDARVILEKINQGEVLGVHANCSQGIMPADRILFIRYFWEIMPDISKRWKPLQSSSIRTELFGGLSGAFDLESFDKKWKEFGSAYKGHKQWDKLGICISQMSSLPVTLYLGSIYDGNIDVVVPNNTKNLVALWCFFSTSSFEIEIRKLEQKLDINTGTILKVPFDLAHWQAVAAEKYPDGLPKPHSDDPTQWLFNGHPQGSDQPLHVAVARLLGYRWPRQTGSSFPDCPALDPDGLETFADDDGIVCLPPLNREQPAAARLRQLLHAALGSFDERALIARAGLKGSQAKTLEDWLRDEFFAQHAKLFHDRPFIWHLWDGRPDGFHALVNYHTLDHATLQKLTYSYLGNWIQQQAEDAKADKPGAAVRLGAAQKLQTRLAAILIGEAPLDIFVRWKPLHDQAQGWHPDLNDGIRQNIRPFLLAGDVGKKGAGLFRSVPLAVKDKDRGTEPHRPKADFPWFWCEKSPGTDPTGGKDFVGARWNEVHLSLGYKQQRRAG
ncbi:MAG: Eco57I restriction-modification methylase domain-containing protein [Candidatus Competibacteraceae bacterium]